MKNKIKKFICKNKVLYFLLKFFLFLVKSIVYRWYGLVKPVEQKTILFESFQGRSVCCSPKAIYLEALSDDRFSDYTFVWALRDVQKHSYLLDNRNTKIVRFNSREYFRTCAVSKYWITNSTMQSCLKPKKNQAFIQTWHGTPLKRLGCDISIPDNKSQSIKEIHKQYIEQGNKITYFLSPSQFYTEKISSAFSQNKEQIKRKFINCGYPRNDFLFKFSKQDVERIKNELNIPKDKKVILYAPTFRDNNYDKGFGFHYDIGVDFKLLKEKLSEEYVILFRAHYFIIDNFDLSEYKGFVYDVSRYDDINELYIISDVLVTDYSSVFFDYANLKRPIIFFMYDYDFYKNKMRDFYIDLGQLPGDIVYKNSELCEKLIDCDKKPVYDQRYQSFNQKYNTYNDQDSSKRALGECIK